MKARPILFTGEMVNAIRDGRKTQTRRVVKPQPAGAWAAPGKTACPYGKPGDLLWVRETCQAEELPSGLDGVQFHADGAFRAIADTREAADRWFDVRAYGYRDICVGPEHPPKVVPSIHMPRWASRLTLRLTDARVERVQDISEEDARAEGGPPSGTSIDAVSRQFGHKDFPRSWFSQLWDSINAKRGHGWEANPWVWALTFEPIWQNVDEVETKHPAGAG